VRPGHGADMREGGRGPAEAEMHAGGRGGDVRPAVEANVGTGSPGG